MYVIAFGCTWPVLLNTIDGVRGVPASVRDTARAYRLPARLRLRRVLLPGAMPQIVTGVRVALSLGVILVVVSELFGAEAGIGYYIGADGTIELALPEGRLQRHHHIHDRLTLYGTGLEHVSDRGLERA